MLSYLKRIDPNVFVPAIILTAASLLTIYSIAPKLFPFQVMWILIGLLAYFFITMVDLRPLMGHRGAILVIYFISIALLAATFVFAPSVRGTRSWLVLGPVQFQTSELAKVALVITLSYFFAKRHVGIAHLSNILIPSLYFALPAAFILVQPDMGTVLILGGVFLAYLFISGLRPQHIAIGILIAVAASFWAWGIKLPQKSENPVFEIQGFLKDYQKERVLGLFNPERDPLGANYNVIQSKIAIGSAGFWGKGFKQGTQVQLGFLPEAPTDFIYAAFIEEWGLLGGLATGAAFLWLILGIIWVGLESRNNFSKLICLGTTAVFLLHLVFNVGSATGIFPVVGVPFPFLSYGGSNLLVNFILLGMVASISARKSF